MKKFILVANIPTPKNIDGKNEIYLTNNDSLGMVDFKSKNRSFEKSNAKVFDLESAEYLLSVVKTLRIDLLNRYNLRIIEL